MEASFFLLFVSAFFAFPSGVDGNAQIVGSGRDGRFCGCGDDGGQKVWGRVSGKGREMNHPTAQQLIRRDCLESEPAQRSALADRTRAKRILNELRKAETPHNGNNAPQKSNEQ